MKTTDELINKLSEDAQTSESKEFNVSSYSRRTLVFLAVYLSAVLLILGPRDDWLQQINQPAYTIEILLTLFLVVSAGIASVRFSVPKALKQSSALLLPAVSVALAGCCCGRHPGSAISILANEPGLSDTAELCQWHGTLISQCLWPPIDAHHRAGQ